MTNEWDLLGTGQATAFVGAVEGRLYELHSVAEVLDLLGTIRESADPAIALVHDAGGTSVGPLLPSLAGVISTQPAHLMNAGQPGLPVALRGRVPVLVIGPVCKGDSLVTSSVPGHAQSVGRDRSYAQAVFAKAVETNTSPGEKIITAVIL